MLSALYAIDGPYVKFVNYYLQPTKHVSCLCKSTDILFLSFYNYFRFRARPWHHLSCLASRRLFSSVSSWTLKVVHWVLKIIYLQPFSRNFILLLSSLLSLNFILATAILDFWSMSNVDVTRYRKWHHWKSWPENMGIAVGILLPCALELEICLAVKYSHLPVSRYKIAEYTA